MTQLLDSGWASSSSGACLGTEKKSSTSISPTSRAESRCSSQAPSLLGGVDGGLLEALGPLFKRLFVLRGQLLAFLALASTRSVRFPLVLALC